MKKLLLNLFFLATIAVSNAQFVYINFTAQGSTNTIDSLKITNLNSCSSVTVNFADTLLLVGPTHTENHKQKFNELKIFPNPFNNEALIQFENHLSGLTTLRFFDINGKILLEKTEIIEKGSHTYSIKGFETGTYLLSVTTPSTQFTNRFVVLNNNVNNPIISKKQTIKQPDLKLKSIATTTQMSYNNGDSILIKAFSHPFPYRLKLFVPINDTTLDFEFLNGSIIGLTHICQSDNNIIYSIDSIQGLSYLWQYIGNGLNILSGQGTHQIDVTFLNNAQSGILSVTPYTSCGMNESYELLIQIDSTYNTFISDSICNGTSYQLGSQIINTAGIYTEPFLSENACDSIVTLQLSILPTYTETVSEAICEGDTFNFGTQIITLPGIYNETFTSQMGCDSSVTLHLNVNPIFNVTDSQAICQGQTYIFGSQHLTTSGVYTEAFQTHNSCDSIVALTLTVNPTYITYDTVNICQGQNYMFGGYLLSYTGDYSHTFQSEYGCDSLVYLRLNIHQNYTHYVTKHICWGQVYSFGSQNLTESGNYTELFQSAYGCDSLVSLNLYVKSRINKPTVRDAERLPTGGFKAKWNQVSNNLSYKIDVSTNIDFTTFVPGYEDRDVGNVLFFDVDSSIINCNTNYYYRVRATDTCGPSINSMVISVCNCGGVYDVDNNYYSTVLIGDQCWMKENLRTTHYNNNTPLTYPDNNNTAWTSDTTGAYACYLNIISYCNSIYGALYNWYALKNGNLCPTGWHVPTDDDWKTLEEYIGMPQAELNLTGWRGTIEGGKLKTTNTDYWNSPNTGATNETGFSAPGAGVRYNNATYGLLKSGSRYWSSTITSNKAWTRFLKFDSSAIDRLSVDLNYGYPVRCLKN